MDLEILAVAFFSGLIMLRFHLPPLVGFLGAGFALHGLGYSSTPMIESFADLGVTLLLFSIGLKLDVNSLFKKEIWLGSSLYSMLTTLLFTLSLIGIKALGLPLFSSLTFSNIILIAFALSFSSTVFAIKVLQEKGEMNATYGNVAIGVLIMQDIFAVTFLTITSGEVPRPEALLLFALPLLRPLMFRFLDQAGHGEVLLLYGIFLALVIGAGLFESLGMKADLGALIVGMLMATHPKASEMAKSLFNIKELFLVCFFINIGLSEEPTLDGLLIALFFILLLPLKGALYFLTFSAFKFRPRTAFFTSATLFNYSEFALIVGGVAYKMGAMPGNILVAIAIAVSLSFVIAAPLNTINHPLYQFINNRFIKPTENESEKEKENKELTPKEENIDFGDAEILILGMGRIGCGAYNELEMDFPQKIISIETREDTVQGHHEQGRNVLHADGTDPDFWPRIKTLEKIRIILLSMPNSHANNSALEHIRNMDYTGKIAVIARYPDEIEELHALGVDAAYNIYLEAGSGFGRHVKEQFL